MEAARKTLLVPIDFEAASLAALAMARDLGTRLGLEVVLLHTYAIPIVTYPGFESVAAPELPAEIATGAKNALEKLAAEQGGLRAYVRAGEAAAEILAAVGELDPAMVVMGTHGRRGLAHLLLGSVTERVVRTSPVPVLTVHARAAAP